MVVETLEVRFGKRLRKLREKSGMSQVDMQAHGFSLSHYQKMERGVVDPRLSTLVKLCEAFGVPVSALADKL